MIKYSIQKNSMMMKILNKLPVILCLLSGLTLGSCDDDTTKVGITILPPEDLITVYSDTFQMEASTIKLDSVFAKTSEFLLGEMYDPVYGNIKADILCQFYCDEGFKFDYTPYEGRIDSLYLIVFYPYNNTSGITAYGDTMTPMQASAYPINRALKKNFYTNDSPENYCDMSKPLGATTYTAYDFSVSDSLRYLIDVNGYFSYSPSIKIKLPVELGQKFYDETINNPSSFESQSAFNEFFPGVYITTTYGSGCIIKTLSPNISMRIYYNRVMQDSNGGDSLVFWLQEFTVSKEVIQINRFKNSNIDKLLEKTPTHTYIKSPSGVCTKLVIPTTEISKKLDVNDRYINDFNLELKYLPEDEWSFSYAPPSHLLLIPEDSVKAFFEDGKIENGTTSFVSFRYDRNAGYTSAYTSPYGYNPATRTYSFGNISPLIKTHMLNDPDKDLNLLAIPITRTIPSNSSNYYTTAISNTFNLSGAKIRIEDEYMKVVVLSSKFEDKN